MCAGRFRCGALGTCQGRSGCVRGIWDVWVGGIRDV